jgi:Glycosyl hydrolases family 6
MIVSLGLLGALLAPAAAQADASTDPSGFRLQSSSLTVNENAGQAVITIERTDTTEEAQIRYITLGDGVPCGPAECTAVDPTDFTSGKGMLDFPIGVSQETFAVPIVDHGTSSVPKTIQVSLFGPSPIGLGSPSKAVLTIRGDDPVTPRDPQNPLALPVSPGAGNPLSGATFFVDPESEPAHAALQNPALDVIAREPGTARFGSFSFGKNGLFLEMDSLITMPCLTPHGQAVREAELRYAINTLVANCPHLVIYLDAGAADALRARDAARFLRASGVAKIQGFFLNSTHFDWTSNEIRYGNQIARMTRDKHFVVNTAVNGQGPLRPRDIARQGNEVLCNPPGRGLGPLPTAHTGYRDVDMFAWIGNPGESGGSCVAGAPPTGVYWPDYAAMLVQDADFTVR